MRFVRVRAAAAAAALLATACPLTQPVAAEDPGEQAVQAAEEREPREPLEPLAVVVHPAADRTAITTRALARTRVLAPRLVPAEVAPRARRLPSEAAVVRAVARDRDAVGVVRASAVRPVVRAIPLDGVDPLLRPRRYPLKVPGVEPGVPTTLFAAGDIMLSRSVHVAMVKRSDFSSPFRATWRRSRRADIAFANLETAVSASHAPLPSGTRFVSDVRAVAGLARAGFDVVSLANNHTGDFGGTVLRETVRLLRAAGVAAFGAGADEARARRPVFAEANGVRFAFLAFNAIVGTPAATETAPGAVRIAMEPWFPFSRTDLDAFLDDVRAADREADVVIVYPHWGTEYRARPDPRTPRVARAILRAGADMVVGTHPHWVQSAEFHRGKLIAYSLGNYVFDQMWSRDTREGAALELVFWGAELKRATFLPVVIEDYHRPRFASGDRARRILARIWPAGGTGARAS